MQYRLRSLVIATTVCPPLLAGLYWGGEWLRAHPIALGVAILLGMAAAWIVSPIVWYRELMFWVCGPECFGPQREKSAATFAIGCSDTSANRPDHQPR